MKRIMVTFGKVKTFATDFYVAKFDMEQMTQLYLSQTAFCDPYKALKSIQRITEEFDNTNAPQSTKIHVWVASEGKLDVEEEEISIKWIKTQ